MAIPRVVAWPAGWPRRPWGMTGRSLFPAVALALPLLGGACATTSEAEKQVQRDLQALREDLRAVNLTVDANRARADQQMQGIGRRAEEEGRGRAAFLAQLQELVTEVRLAQGKLEENAGAVREANRRLDEAMNRVASLGTQVVSLEGQLQAQQERMEQLVRAGQQPIGQGGPPPGSESADQIYRTALMDFTKQNYEPAAQGFQAFARNFSQDSRAPDAQYWLAESYRAQGNYAQAAREFEGFVRKYPESPRIATAQVRYGESLLLSGDKGGCAVLQEVRARYARARAGVLARDLTAQHCP